MTKFVEDQLVRATMAEALSRRHVAVVPHVYFFSYWESDVLSVLRSGRTTEYEIKTSMADYNRDFKKEWKHQKLQWGYGPAYFYFVTGPFDIDPPPYTGWWQIVPQGGNACCVVQKRKAPKLNDKKVTIKQMAKLTTSLSFRLLRVQNRIRSLQDAPIR